MCFEPASEGGGEFFIADGAKIVNDLDKENWLRGDRVRVCWLEAKGLAFRFVAGSRGLRYFKV